MKNQESSPLQLIDRALALWRSAPPSALTIYLLGTLPFIFLFTRFCSEMSYSRWAPDRCESYALGLAAVFIWMKGWHSISARILWQHLLHTDNPEKLSIIKLWLAQAAIQPLGLILRPLAAICVIPHGVIELFFQCATLLFGSSQDALNMTLKAAKIGINRSLIFQSLMGLIFIPIFLNFATLLVALPQLLKTFFGVSSFLTNDPYWMVSAPFLVLTLLLAYFTVDMLQKGIAVIRCSEVISQTSGKDLKASIKLTFPAKTIVAFLVATLAFSLPVAAATLISHNPNESALVDSQKLNQNIQETAQRPEFGWRHPQQITNDDSLFGHWLGSIKSFFQYIGNTVVGALAALIRFLTRKSSGLTIGDPRPESVSGLQTILIVIGSIGMIGLLWFLISTIRVKRHKHSPIVTSLRPPDLEEAFALDLPEDEWLKLAHAAIQNGDTRAALRSLFLATIALLAKQGLIVAERWKSNRDYETELKKRDRSQIAATFISVRKVFEQCWYGDSDVTQEEITRYETLYLKLKNSL
jgi:hypothetical protein